MAAGVVTSRAPLRVLAFVAALALVSGSCATDKGEQAASPNVGGSLTTLGGSSTTRAGGSAAGTTRSGSGTSAGKTGGGANNASSDADVRAAADGPPGAFAGMLLAPGPADAIVLDVLVQPSVSADPTTVSQLRQILAASAAKPVTARGPTSLSASGNVYSADDLRRLADTQGGPTQGNGTAVVHVLYLNGSFTDDAALGVTVRGDVIGVFPDQIAQAATPLVSRARIERAVVTHELGHVLGLVDLFLDDGRDDPDHPGHSTNPHSVMYWAVESDLVTQLLDGPPPVDFDGQDQADLRKIHTGAPHA